MRAVAAVLCVSLLGCFPHSAKKRTYAQLAEGGALVAGIGINFLINSGADCDQMGMPGTVDPNADCHTKANVLGDVGFGLILGGLVGFIATISTAQDNTEAGPAPLQSESTAEKPQLKLPPGVKGNAGSAAVR
jgi:hypothetical protein